MRRLPTRRRRAAPHQRRQAPRCVAARSLGQATQPLARERPLRRWSLSVPRRVKRSRHHLGGPSSQWFRTNAKRQ
ncbi:Protein of unknown function [Gryllus bimaculatus]|nr:Protein of unknown function [Gryllus bimaculatus]